MSTEDVNAHTVDLDMWGTFKALAALHAGQMEAVAAVGAALPALAAAVDAAAARLRRGGRLVYVGAGTSGRLGALDGAELPPTFDWPRERVVFVMAGGAKALTDSAEGAEDASADGAARIAEIAIGAEDVVIGLAASGETPFTTAAIEAARARGALTIGVANNAGARLLRDAEHAIFLDTGAEAIAGSTRMKAGTAQKALLTLFSTMAMVRLGRVYRGMMVEMRPTNEKLKRRAVRMVAAIAGCPEDVAARALDAEGEVKRAALVARGMESEAARALLAKHDGNLRAALADAAVGAG
jgi:N-acetylmuramic acid 6-phosphate etherase